MYSQGSESSSRNSVTIKSTIIHTQKITSSLLICVCKYYLLNNTYNYTLLF